MIENERVELDGDERAEQEKTRRLYFRVAEATAVEIDEYIVKSGLTRAQFLTVACVAGARLVARSFSPEYLVELMAKTMVREMMTNEEFVDKLLAAGEQEVKIKLG